MRLIDADALDYGHYKGVPIPGDMLVSLNDVAKENKAAPTIDPVHAAGDSYCFECEHCDPDGGGGYCNFWRRWTIMSAHCSNGKRKEAQDA